jgi:hypothetical protein
MEVINMLYMNESVFNEISKLNFLGTFVINKKNLKNNMKSRNLIQFDKVGDYQIRVYKNVPKILENLFIENQYQIPVLLNKHNNLKVIEGLNDRINLEDKLVLFKLVISKNKIQVKLIKIFEETPSDNYMIIPIARKKRSVNIDISNLHISYFNLPSYPIIFGTPSFFYYKSNIYIHKFSITKRVNTNGNFNPIYQDSNILLIKINEEDIKQTELLIDTEIANRNSTINISDSFKEYEFLEILLNNAKKVNLFITERDVMNFHTSLKTSIFTILDGHSGVGKSELIRLYANTIGLDLSTNFFEVPISQNITSFKDFEEDYDVRGFIEKAYKDDGNLYFLVLEDFNSANVEVYLSDLLYLISRVNSTCTNFSNEDMGTIKISDNLIIIGTVSKGISAYPITPKLIDRANYVYIEKSMFKNIPTKSEKSSFITLNIGHYNLKREWTVSDEFIRFFSHDELKIFDAINDLLIDYSSNVNINFRTLIKMAKYSMNLFSGNNKFILNRAEVIDLVLYMNLVPKIYGSHPALSMIVGEYNGSKWTKGELIQLLESDYAKNISNFHLTIQALNKKAKELEYEGYAR